MFSLICSCLDGWVNNREAGDLRRHCDHYDVSVMYRAVMKHTSLRLSILGLKFFHVSKGEPRTKPMGYCNMAHHDKTSRNLIALYMLNCLYKDLSMISFLHTAMTQVVKIFSHIRKERTYDTSSISWAPMSWRCQEPGHQQPWWWLCRTGIIRIIRSPHI